MALGLPRSLWFYLLLLAHLCKPATSSNSSFVFNGFHQSDLSFFGSSAVARTGALRLTTGARTTDEAINGQAFYPRPLQFIIPPADNTTRSFSTCFVFEIVSEFQEGGGHGMAFIVAPSTNFSDASGGHYFGLFNTLNNGNSTNHVFAVEFDTVQSVTLKDMDANHIGVDVNGVISNTAESAAYYTGQGNKEKVVLDSQIPIQAWIDYDGHSKQLNVTIAPLSHPLKPSRSLISYSVDLFPVLREYMYVGFSSSTQKLASKHYILAWSFMINGEAPELDLSHLPSVPREHPPLWKAFRLVLYISVASATLLCLIVTVSISCLVYRRSKLTSEKIEGWETDYPHRFPYRELYTATKGFRDKELLGKGGFGSVYKGVLPGNGMAVAIKKVTHGGKQGLREFIAELSSLGKLRHRNLVQLQGWCRRGEDMLLVYDFMPNGSLDSFLFGDKEGSLSWEERFKIVKGIASGLLYLHEEWEQVIVHRDIKASNVLLDADLNARLGDFGLARLYEHGSNPKTTHIVRTLVTWHQSFHAPARP